MKVSELTDDALNRLIHEKVMGDCWHNWRSVDRHPDYPEMAQYKCVGDCQFITDFGSEAMLDPNPNYCQDLNAVAEAERAALAADPYRYTTALENFCGDGTFEIATATARQRAEAVAIAMGITEVEDGE